MFSIQTFPPQNSTSNSQFRLFPPQNDSTSLFSVQTPPPPPPPPPLHKTPPHILNGLQQLHTVFSLTRAQAETHYAVFPAVRVGFPLSDCNGRTLLHAPSYLPDSVCQLSQQATQPARAALYRRQHPSPGDAHVLVPFFAERVF